ncbi:MAG: tetratricopeptide repeat protein [Acidobacteriota bacterium]
MNTYAAGCAVLACALSAGAAVPPAGSRTPPPKSTSYYHYLLGSIAEAQNDLDLAKAEYQRATDADPASADIRTARARVLLREHRLEDMKQEIDRVLADEPDHAEANELLGWYYYSMRDLPESMSHAAQAFEKAVAAGDADSRVYYVLGQLYIERNTRDPAELRKALDAFSRYTAAEPDNPEGYFRKGLIQELLKDDAAAEQSYSRAIQLSPGFAPAYRALLGMYARAGRMDDLQAAYRRILAANPDDLRTRAGLAATLYDKSLYAQALEVLDYDRLGASYDTGTRTLAARIYGRLNRPAKVIEMLKDLREQPDAPVDALFELARAYESQGDLATSASLFERILKDDTVGNRDMLLFHLGFAQQTLKRNAEAEKSYSEAIQIARTSGDREMEQTLLRYMVEVLAEAGQVERARAAQQEALKAFPDSFEIQMLGAEITWTSGEKQNAIDELKRLDEAHQDSWEIKENLARKQFELNDYKDVCATLDRAQTDESAPVGVMYLLGAAYERRGDVKRARAVFETGLKRFPDAAEMMNYLGYMLIEKNIDLQHALELVRRAVEIEPENEAYLDSMAWGSYRLGNLQDARKFIDQAVTYGEPNWEIFEHAGDIYCALHDARKAVELYQKALTLSPQEPARIKKKLQKCAAK